MMGHENIIEKFIERIEYELDELMVDICEFGMTDFVQGEGYGYIICLEILKSLLPELSEILDYDIENKYKDIL